MTDAPLHPIKAFRAKREMSLKDLAAEIGVQPNTIWRWENGRMPRRREWPRINRVTGINPSELAAFSKMEPA